MMQQSKGLESYRVLIIDDRFEARAMLKNMLMELGITQVFEAGDGKEGMQFVDSAMDFVDIIISDWNMPEMDGATLLRQIRSCDPDMPFLMVTGRGDIRSVSEAKSSGVSAYILKPYSLVQLEAKLRVVAARREQAVGLV
ncbi:MAG: response regulator [Alphaproteobacteria bacterium]|nr:response regulator [Alphaproteobacteria bacterium]